MDALPNEMLLPILALVDGATLVRCQRVCKRWRGLVEAILQHGDVIWKMMCQSEIDPDVLAELLGHSSPEDKSGDVKVDWFNVYKRWHSTNVVSRLPPRICKVQYSRREHDLTCVKVSGDIIVTGHKNGDLVVRRADDPWPILIIATLGFPINDLAFFNLRGPATLSPGPFCYKHIYVICASQKPKAYSLEYYRYGRAIPFIDVYPITSVRVCGDLMAALSLERCALYVSRLKLKEGGGIEFELLQRYLLKEGVCRWIGLSTHSVFHMGLYWQAGKAATASQASETWRMAPVDCKELLHVSLALVQREGIFIIATIDMRLYISMDAGHHIEEVKAARQWNGRVTAMALQGPLLAIGLDSGRLCVYRTQGSLIDIVPRLPDWSQQLYKDPIISVDVTSELDTMRPIVAAATRWEAHLVSWPLGSV